MKHPAVVLAVGLLLLSTRFIFPLHDVPGHFEEVPLILQWDQRPSRPVVHRQELLGIGFATADDLAADLRRYLDLVTLGTIADIVPLTGQERAWTSPIWYTPSAEARKNAQAGMTVADLNKKGATPLGDAQLKALIVGKAFWVRNNVTGEQFSQSFTAEGRTTVFHVGKYANMPSGYGDVMRDGYQGTTTAYKIESGKLITPVSQDPYPFTVYKLGNTYYGARSNEFGYANYEIIPMPQIAANPLTDLTNQLSTELGLTEDQKKQFAPILKEELSQLQALKKDESLDALKKVERLRAIGSSFDAKMTPLLNAEQQKKFQAFR